MAQIHKRQDVSALIFFQGLEENTSLQPALKSTASGLEVNSSHIRSKIFFAIFEAT